MVSGEDALNILRPWITKAHSHLRRGPRRERGVQGLGAQEDLVVEPSTLLVAIREYGNGLYRDSIPIVPTINQ